MASELRVHSQSDTCHLLWLPLNVYIYNRYFVSLIQSFGFTNDSNLISSQLNSTELTRENSEKEYTT